MEKGYRNGSDLLLKVGGKPVGHCASHKVSYSSDTKDRQVKPVATLPPSAGLWKQKGVTGQSISISFEGLRFYGDEENNFEEIAALWGAGQSVEVEAFQRTKDSEPSIKGKFVITSLDEDNPAQDDATYSGQLESDGEPDVYPGKPATTTT